MTQDMVTKEQIVLHFTHPYYYGEERQVEMNGDTYMIGGHGNECFIAMYGRNRMKGKSILTGFPSDIADELVKGQESGMYWGVKLISRLDPDLVNGL